MKTRLILHNGRQMISIDGALFSPVSFRSFRPAEKYVRAFGGAGIRLMSVFPSGIICSLGVPYSQFGEIWLDEGRYDFEVLDRQIRLFVDNAPDAYLSLMVHMDTRDWWLRKHREYRNSFTHVSAVSGDPFWRSETERYMKDIISWIEERYGDRFYAYFLFCGGTCEWLNTGDDGSYDAIKEEVFRSYAGDPEAELPLRGELHSTSHGVFRDPVRDGQALRYWRFHNEIVADSILHFAGRVKQWTRRDKLVGVFYGYIGNLGSGVQNKAHLGYERVFASPDIDILFAPADYMLRRYGGPGAFMQAVDSVRLHGKLYFHEIDNTTHIAPEPYISQLSRAHYRSRNEAESIAIMRREFVMATVKGAGLWWFDMFGGWFDSPALMREIEGMREITARLQDVALDTASRVAVCADSESMYYLAANGSEGTSLIARQREALGLIGTPYDFFTMSDLLGPDFPRDRYRLYVFPNAFRLPSEYRALIEESIIGSGKSVLWVYAPGYVTAEGLSVQSMSEMTGAEMVELPRSERLAVLSPGSRLNPTGEVIEYGFDEPVKPAFSFAPGGVEVLGVYKRSGEPAAFMKKVGDGQVFYSGTANIPAAPLREIARLSGAWIYCEDDLPLYCCNRLIGIHVPESGAVELRLPRETEVEELFDGATHRTEEGTLRIAAEPGTMKLFLTADEVTLEE